MTQHTPQASANGTLSGPVSAGFERILTPEAMAFVAALTREFAADVTRLLAAREVRQHALDAGNKPDFLKETESLRASDWRVAPIPADLSNRRVEITGPTERKMIINALNSGANVFMADCEDSLCPSWDNVIGGQINLADAVRRTIALTSPEGKHYTLNAQTAVLIVRPRGWHLYEKHWQVDGASVPGAFVDFGLYLFHNHAELRARGTGPYFYLPKLENHLEARLWCRVFQYAEHYLKLNSGTIKCTVLIETILAAFEMDEILYELRDYIVGLNCGRWDYIFSYIKKLQSDPTCVLPDRLQVTMTAHFLRSYSLLLIETCHRRGAFAMGGMAAQIPIKNDPAANDAALAKVRADKEREATDGHDGTWVAHPALVPIAREVFDRLMPTPNNLARPLTGATFTAHDLLQAPPGQITEVGLRNNISVGIQYLAAWLGGNGCVPINNLMEDAATAEISRAQVWQWLHKNCALSDGRVVTRALLGVLVPEELARIEANVGRMVYAKGNYVRAAELFNKLTLEPVFASFLTLSAYREIN